MANFLVTDITGTDRLIRQVRKPQNDNPSRVLVEWHGRINVANANTATYDDDNGIPLATVSSDVISAGMLYTAGCRRASDVVKFSINGGLLIAGTDWTAGGANVALDVAYDRTKASIRVFQTDVAVADTADHQEEAPDNADLSGATYLGASAGFCDVEVLFWCSDLTVGAG